MPLLQHDDQVDWDTPHAHVPVPMSLWVPIFSPTHVKGWLVFLARLVLCACYPQTLSGPIAIPRCLNNKGSRNNRMVGGYYTVIFAPFSPIYFKYLRRYFLGFSFSSFTFWRREAGTRAPFLTVTSRSDIYIPGIQRGGGFWGRENLSGYFRWKNNLFWMFR